MKPKVLYVVSTIFLCFLSLPLFANDLPHAIYPDDKYYEKARLISNYYSSKNKFPKAITYCENADDVKKAILYAKSQKLPIRVRSGGHNHEGFSTGSDALVIDVSKMKKISIDKEKKIATVQPGITGGELYSLLSKEGLTQVGGTCKDVGISGLILTGGMGPLNRQHGLACDNLISFDLINANGDLLHVRKDNEYKDLFNASCGAGGGNFGVVTSLTLKVYPAKPVTWFNIGWDWNQPIETIIKTWQQFFSVEDPLWFSHLDLWAKKFPTAELKKQPIKVLGVFYGEPEEAKKKLKPFLNIGKPNEVVIEKVEWPKAIKQFEEATETYITEKPEYKSTGAFAMTPFPEKGIETIVTSLKESPNPLLNVLLFSLGGAIKNISPTETAYFYRQAKFFLVYSSQWLEKNQDSQVVKELDDLRNKLIPFTEGDYIGNPDRSFKNYMKEYFGENVDMLKRVKKKYDPDNLFNFEQSIPIN